MDPRRRLEDWHHMLIMSLVMALVSGGLAYLFLHVDLIPDPASIQRGFIDPLMKMLLSIAAVFFGIIVTMFSYAIIFFRRRRGDDRDGPPIRGNRGLELTWTLIPLAVVIGLGVYAAMVLDKMTVPPVASSDPIKSELQVDVLAFRYGWQFHYPSDDVTSFELVLPVNRPVLFRIQSKDVVHSFWVQEFGPKQDAVPGMTTQLLVTPTKTGDFQVRCSQLCGWGHTLMVAPVHVVSASDFQSWLQQQKKSAPASIAAPTPGMTFGALAQAGSTVYSAHCAICHGANGQGSAGPALWGANAVVGKYGGTALFKNNAQAMLSFISTQMPLSAPGSLSHQQYLDVLCHILVQDEQVSSSVMFDESQLANIGLK